MEGIALHAGTASAIRLLPASPDAGIAFVRIDVAGGAHPIAARFGNVVGTTMQTKLAGPDGAAVGTVEHLMAALSGCGIDNATVEVNGPEIPIGDGSAAPFVELIDWAGIAEQDALRTRLRILRPVRVEDGQRWIEATPGEGLHVACRIAHDGPPIGVQEAAFALDEATFRSHLARARTYGFLRDLDGLKARGLARGASLDNAVVIDGERIANRGGLRYADEFVRHKLLDLIGDLALAGLRIEGSVRSEQGGHALNLRFLQALFADREAWRVEPAAMGAPAAA